MTSKRSSTLTCFECLINLFQALDQLGHHTDIWNKEVKDTWQTFFRVIIRIMKKGYARQHPGAAIIFVGKGETSRRGILPKPLVVDQKNLITEVSNFTFPFNWQTPMMKGKIHSILNIQQK